MRPSSNSQPVFPASTDSKIDSGLDADPSQKETVEFYRRLPTHKFSQRVLHPGPAGPAGPSDLDKSCVKAGHRQTLLANLEQPICAQPARPMTTALHTAYPGGSSPGRFSLHVRSRGICCCARIAGIEGCTAEPIPGWSLPPTLCTHISTTSLSGTTDTRPPRSIGFQLSTAVVSIATANNLCRTSSDLPFSCAAIPHPDASSPSRRHAPSRRHGSH